MDGVRTGIAAVKDFDERHDVRGKTTAIITRAEQVNQQHDITGKVGLELSFEVGLAIVTRV